jgi:hypothetical protein
MILRRLLIPVALALLSSAAEAQQKQLPSLPVTTAVTVDNQFAGVPASLAGSGSWTSYCVNAAYYRSVTVFATLAAAGTLQIQRYADQPSNIAGTGCTIPVGAAVPSTALALTSSASCPSSGSCGTVAVNDGMSFLAFKATLTDTSSSTNAIVSTKLLQGAE